MRGLSDRQKKVLEAIISDVAASGAPPTQGRIADLTKLPSPHQVLKALTEKGYIKQPYAAGPWVPLLDLDGTPLRLELVRGTQEG